MKPAFFFASLGLFLLAVVAQGSQTPLSTSAGATLSATCSFAGAAAQVVTVTGTSAKTSTATGVGNVRIVCTQDTHFVQSTKGSTTATATTNDSFLPAGQVEYVQANESTFGFIRNAVSGSCFVTECK
jgi:hypothetical protein